MMGASLQDLDPKYAAGDELRFVVPFHMFGTNLFTIDTCLRIKSIDYYYQVKVP